MGHGNAVDVFSRVQAWTVAMLESPGVSVSLIGSKLGIGAYVLGVGCENCVWSQIRRLWATADGAMRRRPSCGEFGVCGQEAGLCESRQCASRTRRDEVSDDLAVPRKIFHTDDVPVLAGVFQRVLRPLYLGNEYSGTEECTVVGSSPWTMTVSWGAHGSGWVCAKNKSGVGVTM